jgi:hypothetical protein
MLSLSKRALVCGFSLGLVAALAPSCGGKNDPSGASSFCADYSNAYCDYAIRCGAVSMSAKNDCLTYFQGSFCGFAVQSAAKGYQTFDTTKAKDCVAAINNASCTATSAATTSCTSLFTPAGMTGGGCFQTSDCKNTAEACGGSTCMKTCQAAGAQGQPCPRSISCNTGLRCDRTTNTCVPPGGVGTDCSNGSSACDTTTYCEFTTDLCAALPTSGQACRTSSPRCTATAYCASGTCAPKLGSGVTCSSFDSSCESGLYCDTSLTPDSCQPKKAVGGSCTSATQCTEGLRCINSLCAAAKTAGQTCSSFSDCADTLSCDRVLRTCGTYTYTLVAGDSCTGDDRTCASGLTCKGAVVNADGGVGTVGLCAAQAIGDSCVSRSSSECPDQAFCNLAVDGGAGSCTAAASGSPCNSDRNCRTTDYCEASLCAARKDTGASCNQKSNCISPLNCIATAPDGGARQCGKLGDVGAACLTASRFTSDSCLFPFECIEGKCTHAGAAGEVCIGGLACITGGCIIDGGPGLCGPKLPAGADCSYYSGSCESGRCTNGKCEAVCN